MTTFSLQGINYMVLLQEMTYCQVFASTLLFHLIGKEFYPCVQISHFTSTMQLLLPNNEETWAAFLMQSFLFIDCWCLFRFQVDLEFLTFSLKKLHVYVHVISLFLLLFCLALDCWLEFLGISVRFEDQVIVLFSDGTSESSQDSLKVVYLGGLFRKSDLH